MSREHEQPGNLARWLDQPPGTDPPADLDDDVVEAIFSLRPERAPAPRVTADDILASVTTGPLVDASEAATPVLPPERVEAGGEVVPFPAAEPDGADAAPDVGTRPARRRSSAVKWLAWAGGTGGVGLALVAAATLLVVATPAMWKASAPRSDQEMNPAAGARAPDVAASPAAAEPELEAAVRQQQAGDLAPAADPSQAEERTEAGRDGEEAEGRSRTAARPAAAPRPAPSPLAGAAVEDALPMDDGKVLRDRSIIPEALEAREQTAGEDEADADDIGGAPSGGETLSDLRGDARPPALTTDWRTGLDGDLLAQVEAKVAAADDAFGAERGTLLEEAAGMVSGTARQVLAIGAAEAYQAGSAYQAMEGITRLGLAEGATGAEAAWLSYLLGVSLEAQGRSEEAASAYRDAATR